MNKLLKISIVCIGALSLSLASAVAITIGNKKEKPVVEVKADDGSVKLKSLTLNKAVTESTSYNEVEHEYNEYASFVFSSVKAGGNVGTISPYSTIIKTSASYALNSVKVSFSGGKLVLKTWYEEDEVIKNYIDLTNGSEISAPGNYFSIEALESEVVINSITFNYGCVQKAPRPNTDDAKITIDPAGGAYLRVEANENVFYGLTGTYSGYIPEDLTIYDSYNKLPIDEILLTKNNRFTIRCNITKHYLNTSGFVFRPHLKYNDKDYGKIVTTFQSGTGNIPGGQRYDVINARYCAWYSVNGNNKTPAFSLQARPVFEINGSVEKTMFRFATTRVNDGKDNHFYPYIIRLVQTNQYYNFNVETDYQAVSFWDFVKPDVRTVLPYKAVLVKEVEANDQKYQVVDFYLNMLPIMIDKINGADTFHGDKKDTFLFHFSINDVKEGNKIITNCQYDYPDTRLVLDTTLGKTSAWGGWPHSEAEDVKNNFYVKGKGQYRAGCPIMEEMPGFGIYEKVGN